ncbi:MAG: hypothetical protein COB59_05475 [Rhodospirillaceae bacterium]|nr:MAG: hypothetical protein COB59_05475 [Rhodospirillaceae bacterium]
MALTVSLHQDERIIVNGAVIALGKHNGQIVFLNHARILHQQHVLSEEQILGAMQADDKPYNDSWFYFVIQLIYIDPDAADQYIEKLTELASVLSEENPEKITEINEIFSFTIEGELYQALKACRTTFPDCLAMLKKTEGADNVDPK